MKKGFALLETIIVITFLSVSLLILYGTFSNMVSNSKRNILYDDAANIYETYYLKEYLSLNHLSRLLDNSDIKEISCNDFSFASCKTLLEKLDINKMYITKYDLTDYRKENYSSSFNNYLDTLKRTEDYKYRLILEFNGEDNNKYASIGINEAEV